jgi:hypothetical protein
MKLTSDCFGKRMAQIRHDNGKPMGRPKNTVVSKQLTLSVTPVIYDFLNQLSASGFYGKNEAETASLLLNEKLRELRGQPNAPGVPPPTPPPPPAG